MPTPDRPNGCLMACSGAANDFNWRLVNGLWGFILAVGLLWTSLTVRQARSWLYFKGWARSFLADYGVPLLVVIWSAVGYCVNSGTPSGIPRRTRIPNTWDEKTNWTVARVCMQLMGSLSIPHVDMVSPTRDTARAAVCPCQNCRMHGQCNCHSTWGSALLDNWILHSGWSFCYTSSPCST